MSLSSRSNRQAATHLRHLGLAGFAMRFLSAKWRARRATIAALSGLGDRDLKDIGLTRSEIGSAVYGVPKERLQSFVEMDITANSAPQFTGVDHQHLPACDAASPARFVDRNGVEVES